MMKIGWRKKSCCYIALITVILFGFSGCSGFKYGKKSSSSSKQRGIRPSKTEFQDVLVPGELKKDKSASFIQSTTSFSAGLLSLKGRVEVRSLIRFFEVNMQKDDWSLVSTFKSPITMMLFQKEGRRCVIRITDKEFSTLTEIWVMPTSQETSTSEKGLLKEEGLLK